VCLGVPVNNHTKYFSVGPVYTLHIIKIMALWTAIYLRFTATSQAGSSVDITTGYGLDGAVGARFTASVQIDPGAHPAPV
jgi:hypothetical protein